MYLNDSVVVVVVVSSTPIEEAFVGNVGLFLNMFILVTQTMNNKRNFLG